EEWLSNEAEGLAYWTSHLSGFSDPLTSTLQARTGLRQAASTIRTVEKALPTEVHHAMSLLIGSESTTRYVAFMAALNVALCRIAATNDVVVASPVTLREAPEDGDVVGCFANTVILRTPVMNDYSFIHVLRETRTVVLEALEHRAVPMGAVVRALN